MPLCCHDNSYNYGRDPFNQTPIRCDREKCFTSKGGPVFLKLFRLDRTDPLSFGQKFPEILVEWIAPYNADHNGIFIFISYSCGDCKCKVVNAET